MHEPDADLLLSWSRMGAEAREALLRFLEIPPPEQLGSMRLTLAKPREQT